MINDKEHCRFLGRLPGVVNGVQLTSHKVPPVNHDEQIKTEKDVFGVCIPTWKIPA